MNGAWTLEARASRTYQDGVGILSTAANDAMVARALAAGAEAKVRQMALVAISGLV